MPNVYAGFQGIDALAPTAPGENHACPQSKVLSIVTPKTKKVLCRRFLESAGTKTTRNIKEIIAL
jgi:hypothetical protein